MKIGYEDRAELSLFAAVARHSATETLAATLQRGLGRMWARVGDWRRRRVTAVALARLDERMLRDIGLTREQLRSVRAGGSGLRDAGRRTPAVVRAETSSSHGMPARSSNDNLRRSRAA